MKRLEAQKDRRAFTIIEVIMVFVILGIVALVIIPRMADIVDMRLHMAVRKVAADLKYAREYAMNHNCMTQVTFVMPFAMADLYNISGNETGGWGPLRDPTTGDDFIVDIGAGDFTGVKTTNAVLDTGIGNVLRFGSDGTPLNSADNNKPFDSVRSVVMSAAGRDVTIFINHVTGRIYTTDDAGYSG